MPPTPSVAPSPITKRSPLFWLRVGAALLAVAVLTVIATRFFPGAAVPRGVVQDTRILIPEARAADAFALVAENADAAGASIDTGFKVTAKVAVSADDVKRVLRVTPSVPVDVTSVGTNEFRVKPAEPLAPGRVYRLAVATIVQKDDGGRSNREFSWAVQTKDVFRVLSSVPGDASAGVPLDSVIEVTLSQTGWEDPKAVFSIEPNVDGRFEVHGRSLAFIPSKPLAAGRLYTATFKKGWKLAGSDLSLQADHVIRFETISEEYASGKTPTRVDPSGTFFEAAPNKEAFVQVYAPNRDVLSGPVTLTGFVLSKDDAKALITQTEQIPWWADATRRRGEAFGTYAKKQSFEVSAALEGGTDSYLTYLRVPGLAPGVYAVRIRPALKDQKAAADVSWFMLQVTNVATYVIADKGTTLLWAMNMDTQRPLSGLAVTADGKNATTDGDGVARLATPALITSTSTDAGVVIAEASGNGMESLIPISHRQFRWTYAYGPTADGSDQSYGYLFADRPLYRIHDSASFFGLSQDRDSRRPSGTLKVVLRRTGFLDFGSYGEKVYAETDVTPDEFGFVRGTMSWDTLAPGYYQLVLQRDGRDVSIRGIEVRDVVKPAFTIDVIPARSSIYAGDAVEGQVKVSLFDGTPMARQKVTVSQIGPYDQATVELMTDDLGMATYRFGSKRQTCDIAAAQVYCGGVWTDNVTVAPVDAEEAQIQSTAFVTVWAARVSTQLETTTKGDKATLSFLARRVDIAASEGREENSVLTDPVSGAAIKGRVVEQSWKRIEQGTTYDYVEKKVVPAYRYELQERDIAAIDLTTGKDGRATMEVAMTDNVSYRVVAATRDEKGADDIVTGYFSKGWYDRETYGQAGVLSLEPTTRRDDRPNYAIDEPVSFSFFKNGAKVPDRETPSFLFVEAMRGIRTAAVTNRSTYEFRYREELVPNMTLYGISFGPSGFVESSTGAAFDTDARKLKVTITPDRASYAPGAHVTAAVDIRTADNRPAAGARVAIAAVDEALLAAAYGGYEESPLSSIYGFVGDGILLTRISHESASKDLAFGGAERGGGGGETIRRNFKDTAAFDVLTADAQGHAVLSFTAPDNITSWRLTAVAATPDLNAGSAQGKVAVTKPVFVDAVIPQTLLAADAPILKLRAFGTGLGTNEQVAIGLESPSLGIAARTVTTTAGTPVYVPVDHLTAGEHIVTMRVNASKGTDAIERRVRVLDSRFTKDDLATVELGAGTTLSDAGVGPEVDVTFMGRGQTGYLGRIQALSEPWSARAEAKIAARIARTMLRNVFGRTETPDPESVLAYQQSSGGISPLPYASEDVELSAKVAATDPDAVDRTQLSNYLWKIADGDVSREEAIRALSGLAALGEPVLGRLNVVRNEQDLSWREKLALARGLEAAGDREASRAILDDLLNGSEERDGLIRLTVDDDPRIVMESTAEAAALAASLAHPKAGGLDAYVAKNWDADTMDDLDRAYFLSRVIPTLAAGDASLTYAAGSDERTIELKNGEPKTVTLTSAEAKAFRVVSANGPLAAMFVRRTTGALKTVPEVSLTRAYAAPGTSIDKLTEGDTVLVTLTPEWQKNAQDGCYIVRDRLPSGLAPLQSLQVYAYDTIGAYPVDVSNNEISFVACKGDKPGTKGERDIVYRARVVSRGTYLAEPASLQSMVAPSVAALTDSKTITIK